MRNILFVLILCFISITSCTSDKPKEEVGEVGEFVYIDKANVLHTKSNCKAVYKDHNSQMVKPVEPFDLNISSLDRVCSQCVTDKQIIKLRQKCIKVHDYDDIKKLYMSLSEDGYTDLGTEKEFREELKDEKNVFRLYKVLTEDGYTNLGTYEEFASRLGLRVKK